MTHQLLRVELHCHTTYSFDGLIRYEPMMRFAIGRQLDAIAITDHDTIEGALEFSARARRLNAPVHIIIGEERTLSDGSHVIGLFLKAPLRADTFHELLAEIRDQDGVCVLPHPFREPTGLLQNQPAAAFKGLCFEVFNAKCSPEENAAARRLFAQEGIAVGGSDAHVEADLGTSVNLFPRSGDMEQSIRAGLCDTGPCVLGYQKQHASSGPRRALRSSAWSVYGRVQSIAPGTIRRFYRAARNTVYRRAPTLHPKTRTADLFEGEGLTSTNVNRRRSDQTSNEAIKIQTV